MKRRDFIKAGICLGCAGAIGTGFHFMKNGKPLTGLELNEMTKQFIYKSDAQLPKKIRLDICTLCQLNCPRCIMRMDEENIKKLWGGYGYVSFDTYKKFIDKHPFLKEIELSNHGEIFLNPDLEKIIKYSYDKGITLTAYTGVNLNTLSDSVAEALVKYKFQRIVVSIDGASQDTYKIYRVGGDFDTVINNIKKINKFKEQYNSKYPLLTYKFILFGHNQHEIEKARALAKELNMKMNFDLNAVPDYSPVVNREKVFAEAGLKPENINYENYFHVYSKKNLRRYFCYNLFHQPQFDWNGRLFGCCIPYREGFGGNVFKDGMLKTLNNEKVLYAKLMLSDLSVEPRRDVPCGECTLYATLKDEI